MKSKTRAQELCPCGSGKPYEACCGRFHAGEAAPDAESLMRSRYSAYARGLDAYVLSTWAEETRPADLSADGPAITWLGLKVLKTVQNGPAAQVEFIARGRAGGGPAFRLHELSDFELREGRWFYTKGIDPDKV